VLRVQSGETLLIALSLDLDPRGVPRRNPI
jgi:hypothetical protein